ncbi:MAG TPA: Gfo/Idh/MocA family oxidoreductase [Candidatus Limiplasma sp.]|nr:Gfo/Idh/MocA family oxidoreductase [Candidatus Limiplasma sp.]
MEKLRAGVIGLGFIGPQHIDGLRRVPGAQVAAVCGRDEANLRAVQARYDVPKAYTDWRDLVADPDIDVVHNCTPNALHDEINRSALLAGKHVYCEKPLSQSAAEARALWRLAVEKGLAHGLNHQYRMNAPVQEMKTRLQKGLAGRPLLAYGYYLQESGTLATDWAPRMGNTGIARAMNDIGIHWVDTACCVLGQPVVSVMADLTIHHPVRTDVEGKTHPMDTEDTGCILLRFADGTPGSLIATKAATGHQNDLRVAVSCENYSMEWSQEDPDRLTLGLKSIGFETVYMNPLTCQPETRPYITTPAGHVMGWPDALHNALDQYYASILSGSYRTGRQPYATFEDGFRGMAFVEACVRSQQTRQWADVEQA